MKPLVIINQRLRNFIFGQVMNGSLPMAYDFKKLQTEEKKLASYQQELQNDLLPWTFIYYKWIKSMGNLFHNWSK